MLWELIRITSRRWWVPTTYGDSSEYPQHMFLWKVDSNEYPQHMAILMSTHKICFYGEAILMSTHTVCFYGDAILMSTHNICFYGELTKSIFKYFQIPTLSVPVP